MDTTEGRREIQGGMCAINGITSGWNGTDSNGTPRRGFNNGLILEQASEKHGEWQGIN